MMRRALPLSLFLALLPPAVSGQTPPVSPTSAPVPAAFEADYQKVLHIMKSPPATGVLVADVTKDGPGDKAGLKPGDIITTYDGAAADTLHSLKQALADALAAQVKDETIGPKVELKLVRDGKPVVLAADRGGLEVTPLEVRSGVAAELNPPATPRDKLAVEWDLLMPPPKGDGAGAAVQPARRQFLVFYSAEGAVLAVMQFSLAREGPALESDMKVFTREDPESPTLHITAQFVCSDGKDLPPFLLDTLTYDNPLTHFKVQRQGTRLVERGRTDDARAEPTPSLMTAVPLECGVESLAAAMPHEAARVLAFPGLDPYSLQTRLGYALVTMGQRKVTINKKEQPLWGVQLMRFAQVEMTWWFDDQRRLVLIEGPDLHAEAVPSEDAAKALLKGKQ